MNHSVKGIAASPGVWAGKAHRLAGLSEFKRERGSMFSEAEALGAAMDKALADIASLAAGQEGEAAEILAFQTAMLEDPALSERAFESITYGSPAHMAWQDALDDEIAGYEASDDSYFRARSADLADIRDRVLAAMFGVDRRAAAPPGSVITAEDLKPSEFLGIDWTQGGAIALAEGSPASHVAMLARSRGVPMAVGLGSAVLDCTGMLVVDGTTGAVVLDPNDQALAAATLRVAAERSERQLAQEKIAEAAVTADGVAVKVMVNVAALGDLDGLDPAHIDGIGLVRTEFLVEKALRDEETQLRTYAALVKWAKGKPVTIRTFDAGGDKPVYGYTLHEEANPFLGMRGVRLSLMHRDVFRAQLRALLRAAALGPVKIMLPMVTSPDDLETSRSLMDACRDELVGEGVAHAMPELGIMVEVPAVAMAPDRFDAAFLSIGSNDLTQYATAAGRDSAEAARWADVLHPGVLAMIAATARHGAATGREVSLCGDAGGDPRIIPHLLRAGVRSVSVAPALVATAKQAIRDVDLSERETAA